MQILNALMVIELCRYQDAWVFDDASVGLEKAPFIQGILEMDGYPVENMANLRGPRHA